MEYDVTIRLPPLKKKQDYAKKYIKITIHICLYFIHLIFKNLLSAILRFKNK